MKNSKKANLVDKLLPLLYHINCGVRLSAATHLLKTHGEKARTVLRHISESEKGENGFTAKMTLKEWDKGNLKSYL